MNPNYITVFTPTFNREKTLPRVYKSLIKQTYENFEWLIIDDGSTDKTQQLVSKWRQENKIQIRYFRKTNSGKPSATNFALSKAKGELFFTLDSDDSCKPRTLEVFNKTWENINSDKSDLVGILFLCQDENGRKIGQPFPRNIDRETYLGLRFRYGWKHEARSVVVTEVMKKYKFPSINTKIMPEGVIWSNLSQDGWKFYLLNERLGIYYLWDNTTNQNTKRQRSKHPEGHNYWHKKILNEEKEWFFYDPLYFFKSVILYLLFGFHSNISAKKLISDISNVPMKFLCILAFVPTYMIYLYDKFVVDNGK